MLHIKITPAVTAVLALFPTLLQAQGLQVSSGTQLILNDPDIHLVVENGGIVNSGTITASPYSSVLINGNAPSAQTKIGGSGSTNFYDLNINKTANDVPMNGNINIAGDVNMNGGRVILNGYTLDLLNSGFLVGESNTSFVSGSAGGEVIRRTTMNGPAAFNPGNIGLEVTSGQNLGQVTVRRRYQQFTLSPSDNSIRRFYDVTADQNTGLDASLKVYYLDEDLNGANPNSLYIWTSTAPGAIWNFQNRSGINTTDQYVEQNNIDNLNWVTLGTPNAPLPLDLVAFKARLVQGNGLLTWTTEAEKSVSHFDIERSADGKAFGSIGSVAGKGDNSGQQSYSFTDREMMNGLNFYRLKMVDQDGQFRYSPVEVLRSDDYTDAVVSIFPNPSSDKVWIQLNSTANATTAIQVYDIAGRKVLDLPTELQKGENKIELSLAQLVDGTYLMQLTNSAFGTTKIVKK